MFARSNTGAIFHRRQAIPLPLFTFIMVLSDPVCEVIQQVVKGRDATLTCRMVYDWQALAKQFNAPPRLNVSLSWTGVPGTTVTTTADPAAFSGTLETSRTIQVPSQTIPSCNCTIQFDFSPGSSLLYQYAVNSVTSTCVTEPTTVQRKFKLLFNFKPNFYLWP